MSFRQKLLLLFAVTVFLCVAVISTSVYSTMRQSFERAGQERANAVAAQFRSEFQRRGQEVVRKVEAVAASETAQKIALEINRGTSDSGGYLTEAKALAAQQQLDFLELVDHQGTILSSAQWQAKFGYPESAIPSAVGSAGAFLKREELPNGSSLGLFAVRATHVGEHPLYVIGGERLDQGFLSTLDIPAETRVLLYQNLDTQWNAKSVLDLNGPASGADRFQTLIEQVRNTGRESQGVIRWSADSADAEVVHAIPLNGPNQQVMGVLLVGSSRRPLIALQRQVVSTAMLVGGAGILVAVIASLWFAARVTRPVVSLADAARRVAAGDLAAKVEVESRDELGELRGANWRGDWRMS
jgi:two-component system nitrogen regulation sensor histidine kinase NtrY